MCRACGAPVPLVDGDVVPCVHCGARVEVPTEYRALRDAEARRTEADTAARAIYARLARRPAWFLRVLSGWFSPASLSLGVYPAMFIVGVFVEPAGAWLASLVAPVNYFDTWLPTRSDWDSVVLGFGFAYAGTILGVFGQRHAVSRCGLQSALSARPPRIAGGHAECRLCGAPLVAKQGAIGVACQYCRADNLLVVPTPWVTALAESTLRVIRETISARDAFDAERSRVRNTVLRYVVALTAAAPLFWLAFRQTIVETPPSLDTLPPRYDLYHVTNPPLIIEHRFDKDSPFDPDTTHWAAGDRPGVDGPAIASTVSPDRCHAGVCEFRYYAALARGDSLAVLVVEVSDGASIVIERHRGMRWEADDDWRSPKPEFGPAELEGGIAPGQRVDFRAKIDAWHRIVVRVPDVNAEQSVALRMAIVRGG